MLRASLPVQCMNCFVRSHKISALTRVSRDLGELYLLVSKPGDWKGHFEDSLLQAALILASPKLDACYLTK